MNRIIVEKEGNIFDAQANTVLIHACNCQGVWGAGIAKTFRDRYPKAFEIYRDHCKNAAGKHHASLKGSCLLIPPVETGSEGDKKHWIACLFTSVGFGRATALKPAADAPAVILSNTKAALQDLKSQLVDVKVATDGNKHRVAELYSCRINSGYFGVEWEESKKVYEEVFGGTGDESWQVTVVKPVRKESK